MKVLIVEDETDILNSIKGYLSVEGFTCEGAATYMEAEEKLLSYEYQIVLLDVTLPDGNGLDLLKILKSDYAETGVLILSAKNSLDDKLLGLDSGADDYITKPFHLTELNSRINALIRRRNFKGKVVLNFEEITIHPEAKEVFVNGNSITLTKKEYMLLLYFITNKNRVLTKESIAEHITGDYIDMADNFDFIYSHIKNLRKKIEAQKGKNYLQTIYGMGYKYGIQ